MSPSSSLTVMMTNTTCRDLRLQDELVGVETRGRVFGPQGSEGTLEGVASRGGDGGGGDSRVEALPH